MNDTYETKGRERMKQSLPSAQEVIQQIKDMQPGETIQVNFTEKYPELDTDTLTYAAHRCKSQLKRILDEEYHVSVRKEYLYVKREDEEEQPTTQTLGFEKVDFVPSSKGYYTSELHTKIRNTLTLIEPGEIIKINIKDVFEDIEEEKLTPKTDALRRAISRQLPYFKGKFKLFQRLHDIYVERVDDVPLGEE